MKNYVSQDQIEEAIKLSLAMAKDKSIEAEQRISALDRVFRAWHVNVAESLGEKLVEMHSEDRKETNTSHKKAIKAIEKLAKRDRPVWESDDDAEDELE